MLLSSLIDNKIGDSFALDIVQGVLTKGKMPGDFLVAVLCRATVFKG